MPDKIILITGATDGIGKQTAIDLAKKGAQIIVHGRSQDKCKNIVHWISNRTHNKNISYIVSDLSELNEVRKMADQIKRNYPHIDVLINNAGVYMNEKIITNDGYETTFAVNHLAPFLLTNMLLDYLNKNGRIISVSSIAHARAKVDWQNLNCENYYDGYFAYLLSKLANVLFTNHLSEILEGKNITANSLHPGVISTKLLRTGFSIEGAGLEEGAKTSVYLAEAGEVNGISGKYFVGCKPVESSPVSYDKTVQSTMWDISSKLTGIDY